MSRPSTHKGKCLMCGRGMQKTNLDGSKRRADICGACLHWIRKRRDENEGRI